MGIFHFGRDQKIHGDLKSRGWESGIENPQKIPSKKSPKNPQSRGWGFVIFVAEKSLIGISEKSPIFIRRDWGFLSPGFLPRDFSGMASRMGIFREREFFLVG